MSLKLSICIPTFNRAEYLKEALDSILRQVTIENKDLIEIVISDNASTDGTDQLIEYYKDKSLIKIRYKKLKENLGADKNYLHVVELAKGDYCWMLGSDDAIKPGSINRILYEIENNYDIYLFNRLECDIYLKPKKERFWLREDIGDKIFNLCDPKEFIFYCNHANSIGALFSYLSSIVFKRNNWINIKYDEEFTGTAYSHVYMLLSMITHGNCKLKYIKNSFVLSRQGNDSFYANVVQRFLLDIDGYLLLSDKLFNNDFIVKSDFLIVLKREHSFYKLYKVFLYSNKEQWNNIYKKLLKIGYPEKEILIFKEFAYYKKILKLLFFLSKVFRYIYNKL